MRIMQKVNSKQSLLPIIHNKLDNILHDTRITWLTLNADDTNASVAVRYMDT